MDVGVDEEGDGDTVSRVSGGEAIFQMVRAEG